MGETLDIFITVVSLVVGVMPLTGHGDFFMKGGNADLRKKLYDEEKLQRASGIGLLCYGAVSRDKYAFSGIYSIHYLFCSHSCYFSSSDLVHSYQMQEIITAASGSTCRS